MTSALAEGGCGRWVAKPQEEANFYAEDVNNNIGESNTYYGESNTYCGEDDNSGTDVNEGIRTGGDPNYGDHIVDTKKSDLGGSAC